MRSSDTGTVRALKHGLGYIGEPVLSPDGSTILSRGTDAKGRTGLYVIDVATGRTTPVEGKSDAYPEWSEDGRSIRYTNRRDDATVLVEQSLLTSESREIYRATSSDWGLRVSPDGQQVAFIRADQSAKTTTFMIAPMSGGAPRALWQVSGASALLPRWQWTRDSQAAIVLKRNGSENAELWLIPVTGTQARFRYPTVGRRCGHPS